MEIESPPGSRPPSQVEHDLEAARCLQHLLAEVSSLFVARPAGQENEAVQDALRLLCVTLGIDRATLWQTDDTGKGMALTHFWQHPECVPLRRNIATGSVLPWCDAMLRRGEAFHFSRLEDLPAEANLDVENLRLHGTRSNATFPLLADGRVFGALAFGMTSRERSWTDDEIFGLKLIAQIFSHVIGRQRAEELIEQLRGEIQRSTRASVLGEIAAALAHEVNQPLTSILGNAQAARRFIRQGESEPGEILAILDDIIRDDKRAGGVIQSLRAMLADSPMPRTRQSLNEVVSDVGGVLAKDLANSGIELELDLAPSLPEIKAARVEIQQLIHNLVVNASHAMSNTPAALRRIVIRTSVNGSFVNLSVRDHGCGIPPEHLDRIFEPFHTTRSDGLGLGLSICRRIAEAHGGRVEARNAPMEGAEFSFSVPFR